MSVYAACFCNGLVHICAFLASATEMRWQFVCSSFIVSLLKIHHSYSQDKTVWYVLATVAWVATSWEQILMTVDLEYRSVTNLLPLIRDTKSKNMRFSFEISLVNVMLLWKVLALSKKSYRSCRQYIVQ